MLRGTVLILSLWTCCFVLINGKRDHSDHSGNKENNGNKCTTGNWTAPALSCSNSTQTDEMMGACEVTISGMADVLNLRYGNNTNTLLTTDGNQLATGIDQSPSAVDLNNRICCLLLTVDHLRTSCCRQLARFCESTAGRPNWCRPINGTSAAGATTGSKQNARPQRRPWYLG